MRIYLIRHGIACEPNDPSLEGDRQRPLTTGGREKIEQIAGRLKKLGVKPDLILSSPYLRAEQTAVILANEFGLIQNLKYSDLLVPGGEPEAIISEIVANYMVDDLFIVGHEPCLGLLISGLVAGNSVLAINIKKGGVCCLLAEDLRHDLSAALEWLLTPNILLRV
jgi:phosphohistidine phosphatase